MAEAAAPAEELPRFENPIVPDNTVGGRALIAVIAIMTFLAALTTGAVILVHSAAGDWQSEVAREVTIQVRVAPGRDIDTDVLRSAELARKVPGIADVRAYSRDESARLLEPWLGTGLKLDDLPVPRIVVVRLETDPAPDLTELRRALAAEVPAASLDDHRNFVERMRTMANTAVIGGLTILALMLLATVLSVMFATRGAMVANRTVIEVLHFIGARKGFIAGHFQRRFFRLGLQGGAIGGGCALILFALVELASRWLLGAAAAAQFVALFGTFSIGFLGYAAVAAQVVLIALVAAFASRATVNRMLETIQ
ncbi:MAG: ABC transporter permease [Rhizobiales bacterium]|nr:ABC transporter permease [Hyphomicrobiales bacterium]